jgi:hypothetical protein
MDPRWVWNRISAFDFSSVAVDVSTVFAARHSSCSFVFFVFGTVHSLWELIMEALEIS